MDTKYLTENSQKCLKALEVLRSSYLAKQWKAVPDNALIITYNDFLTACMQLAHETPDGAMIINMEELAKHLFGETANFEPFVFVEGSIS